MTLEPEPAFEVALEQLETIVGQLERGAPELSVALAKYEQGVRLLARCHELLDGAERSVALLSGVDENGNPVTAPFDATATVEREPAAKKIPKRSAKQSPLAPPPASQNDDDDDLIPF
jgi:exodeoxyribonuclease VII small subunit